MFGTFKYFLSLLKFSLCALLPWCQLASLSPLFWKHYWVNWTSIMVQMIKRLPTMWETWVQSLAREDLLEKEMATHSSTLARIPWMEEAGRQQSMGSQRVRHDWVTSLLGKSLTSISLRLVSGSLSCSFVWNIVLCFFIFLDSLCWFLCIKQSSLLVLTEWSQDELISQPGPDFWLSLKPLWLSKPLSLSSVALPVWTCVKTYPCPERKDFSQ